jgi:hypothetical protein
MGGYSVINMSNGKFNIDKDSNSDDKTHLDFKKEVLNKYSNELASKIL